MARVLVKYGFDEARAHESATLFAVNTAAGVASLGVS